MRIGIDAHMLGDHSGGNESYYTNILKNISHTADMELILFVRDGADVSMLPRFYNIVKFEETNPFKRNFMELPKLCRKYNLDLLHTQYFIPFDRPCPVVCTIHDICFEHYKSIFTKNEYFRQKILIPYAARKSKIVFTVSNDAKNDIVSTYKISEDKVKVTYNAVNGDFCKLLSKDLDERSLRIKFGIGKSRYILSVGNLQPRKNLPRLIRAFCKIANDLDDVKLVIVGKKAWMYEGILSESCSLPEKIVFTDYVSNEDLVRLYNCAECFVYPSFFEGFGIPPLEAMACGTPVAVANKTSLPEVVGQAAILFDPFDESAISSAIIRLVKDTSLRKQLIEEGNKRIHCFSWAKSAEIIIKSYKKVLDTRM